MSRSALSRRALLLLVGVLALAAACGGGGGSATTTRPSGQGGDATTSSRASTRTTQADDETIPKDEYIERATELCEDADTAANNIEDFDFAEFDLDEVARFMGELVVVLEDFVEGMRDLPPPDEDADLAEELIESFEATTEVARETQEAAEAGDEEEAQQKLGEFFEAGEEAGQKAEAFGLPDCGEGE